MDIFLDKLEIQGFKSFPDRTVIKFHKGITAVVGPNGCGKSNIVDAVLWVLGEQRIKNLRGENNEDLIFNGSSTKKPLGMTEVSSLFMSQGEPVYVARRFFRSGESKYLLNDKYCRNKDIQDALFDMQLGERKYFIFEQGSIDKLISLKPSEKRILIEEAAGISQYLERKKETANKLIIAEQNLENIEILVQDKQNRLKELKNQVNYARRYRQMKVERNDLLKAFLKKRQQSFMDNFQGAKQEIEKLMNQETVWVKQNAGLEKESIHLEERRWQLDQDLKNHQKRIFDINQGLLSNQKEIEKIKQRNEFIQGRIKELKQSTKAAVEELKGLDGENAAGQKDLAAIDEKLNASTRAAEEIKHRLEGTAEKLNAIQEQESKLNGEIFKDRATLAQLNNLILDVERKSIQIDNEIVRKESLIGELSKQVTDDSLHEKQQQCQDADKTVKARERELHALRERGEAIQGRLSQTEAEANACANEMSILETQKKKYQEIRERLFQHLPQEESPENGFVYDGLNTEKKFHHILENFYHDEMDAVLVQPTEHGAARRENKLLIARPDAPPPGEPAKEPGFISWIKDLYSHTDAHVKESLKNGVLVDSIENGLRIFLKHGLTIATQKGEMITRDGLLIRSRDRGILDVKEEIARLDEKRDSLAKQASHLEEMLQSRRRESDELAEKRTSKESDLNRLKDQRAQLQAQLDTLVQNKETTRKRIEVIQAEIELLKVESGKIKEQTDKKTGERKSVEGRLAELEKKQASFRDEKRTLENRTNDLEKEALEKQHVVDLFKEKEVAIQAKNRELGKLHLRLTSTIEKNEKEEIRLKQELGESENAVAKITSENGDLETDKKQLESQVGQKEADFATVNQELKTRSQELATNRRQLEETRERRASLEIDFSSVKKDLYQLEEKALQELNSDLAGLEVPEDLRDTSLKDIEDQLEVWEQRLLKMRDSDRLNFSAESEYDLLSKDFDFLTVQREDILHSIQDMNDAIQKIDEESQTSFLEAFQKINEYYKKNFKILFEGGEAEISLTDEENVSETGLEIRAQPPGKKLQGLRLLSGGEKALTSLAFLFSLFEYKPSPFCVFDEVDASLDEANIQRFLNFVHKLKGQTQFLIITHNFKTMEEADFIYGISMNEPGISTIYSMKLSGKNQLIPDTSANER